jgi:hypothetical protein
MALPKLEVPTYELELPLSKKKIKYRPFLVKEQKSLLMAMESGDSASIQHTVSEIIQVCTLSEDFDMNKLPILDIEYYFLNLRAKSVGEISESKYRCNNEVDGVVCNNTMESKIGLTDIKPHTDVLVDPEIQLSDKISVKMKYPEFGIMRDSIELTNVTELAFKLIANCVEYIYDGEQFYYSHETTQEELQQFVESLNQEQFEKLENYFNNLPRLKHKVEMKCSKCGFDHAFDVEGLESFFG